MDVDASLELLGGFGLLQTLNFLAYSLCGGSSSWHLTGVAFTASAPRDYWCRLPPNGTGLDDAEGYISEQCHLIYEAEGGSNDTVPCLYGWEYDSMYGETSVVTDLDLVCDRAILAGTLTSIHFGGVLAGSYILGQLSDILGRRLVVLGSLVGLVATGTGLSFTWSFAGMAGLRFLNGFFIPGSLTVTYVRLIEMFTPGRRLKGQLVCEMMWVCGISLLAPAAYLLPNWRHLQLAISLFGIPVIFFVWLSYDSIRWLVQKGRIEKAEKFLQRIAKSKNINLSGNFLLAQQDPDVQNGNKPLSENAIELETTTTVEKTRIGGFQHGRDGGSTLHDKHLGHRDFRGKKATVVDLFKTPVLIKRSLIVSYCWFTSNVVYYGFFINATNLVGNKYLNFFLISVTEAPSYILNYFIMKRFGRRRPIIFVYALSGVTCVITGAIPKETASGIDLTVVILVFAIIGKLFASAAFDIVFLITAEVFPTVLRSAAFGAASMIGKVGGMVAPFIIFLNVYHDSIPMIVFGVLSLIAGALVLPLPETNNRSLPETLEDGAKLACKANPEDEQSPTHA
ncbi:organic cation transporter-like protein [Acanthaster planci]|uniref:Organic cation transporter-like protein n=1 Tax=Acanthaster planci TaxID=133434 RepID=A0A8B7XIV1_ACAPL|nr:organic cation transporter-like protein [Acanthaster planci]